MQVKLIFSFLASYPLAALLKRIPDGRPELKNLFIIALVSKSRNDKKPSKFNRVALFYLVGLFDLWWGLTTLLLDASTAYAFAAKTRGPYMPWTAFVVLMVHMSVSHVYRQIQNDASLVDITGK